MKYVITVEGIEAAPQGSKRHIGRGIMIESCKRVGSWKDAVRIEANKVVDKLIEEPVHIDLVFWFYKSFQGYRNVYSNLYIKII